MHVHVAGCLLLLCGVGPLLKAAAKPKEVIAYVFVKDRAIQASEIDAKRVTRINYAFANIRDGEIVEGFSHDAENYAALHSLKKVNPALEVLASVGGWTWSGGFSDMALSVASRKKFIESAVRFVARYGLDGIDIDWEYPGLAGAGNPFRPVDKQNYTALMREMRVRFDLEHARMGRPLILSVAVGASPEFLQHTEMDQVALYLDTVNLMSYDYYESSSSNITGHHAPLHANPLDPKGISAEASVRAYLAAKVPASKLVLGVPFYGHAWSDVSGTAHGLFQPGKPSTLDTSYQNIVNVLLKTGFVRYWDATASAPYLYHAADRTFVTYEDEESAGLKARFVRERGLRGIMFWEYHGDDHEKLLKSIDAGLHGGPA